MDADAPDFVCEVEAEAEVEERERDKERLRLVHTESETKIDGINIKAMLSPFTPLYVCV